MVGRHNLAKPFLGYIACMLLFLFALASGDGGRSQLTLRACTSTRPPSPQTRLFRTVVHASSRAPLTAPSPTRLSEGPIARPHLFLVCPPSAIVSPARSRRPRHRGKGRFASHESAARAHA